MNDFGKVLITVGIIFVVVGIVWQFGGRFVSFGRLPGDIVVEKENFKFYFPVVTSIVLSIVLSLVLWVISSLRN
ncbi:hypothetical protein BHU72_08505 [Desulfuribacillus stibiiarsenatis]|uniref:DUF2905 domain-containing protein n=1 Tax=Desulfuribacillus stibiiarsenatis TaxID=1390249 RepID=A0A1E5L325_9FIRM|nr:DUF2905 domain-containing protein [Desulfuribacillus stibiiarsenatis]OEH84540.1 hypothetical protein BHU72_08505 [Desulfuribacillus stibiiarsenatis]